ncbi:hypothetical protein HDU96_008298 [Phlyctochytrium bullatum]|nr:hypothetical protein HDU96_008298 [Phlyctochytrium bullatum]
MAAPPPLFPLEALPSELAPNLFFYLNPVEVPTLASASKKCRALFHTPCTRGGITLAGRHILFFGACRNAPCPVTRTPYDAIEFVSLSKTYALAAITVLGLSPKLLWAFYPDCWWGKCRFNPGLDVIYVSAKPERNPKPFCSILIAALRNSIVSLDSKRTLMIFISAACFANSTALADVLLSVVPEPFMEWVLEHITTSGCFRGATRILRFLFTNRRYLKRAKDYASGTHYRGMTGLHVACAWGSEELVRILLKGGVGLETRVSTEDNNPVGMYTALHLAAINNRLPIVRLLLQKGAEVDSLQTQGLTSLQLAAHRGFDDVAVLLLSHGATPNPPLNPDGETPLHMACSKGLMKTVKALLATGIAQVDAPNGRRSRPIHLAADFTTIEQSEEMLDLLLDAGAWAGHKDHHGDTPLHIITRRLPNPARLFHRLVKAGAMLGQTGQHGETAFHNVCRYAKDTCEAANLFSLGAWNLEHTDNQGDTPLLVLARADLDKPNLAARLIAMGANLEARDRELNRTPLHWAAINQHTKLLGVLLNAGADPLARDATNQLPWELSPVARQFLQDTMRVGDPRFLSLLEALIHTTVFPNRSAVIALALKSGNRKNAAEVVKFLACTESRLFMLTPGLSQAIRCYLDLRSAVYLADEDVVKLLLRCGANVEGTDAFGTAFPLVTQLTPLSPLSIAIRKGNPGMIHLLLSHGADVERRTPEGLTALLEAVSEDNQFAVEFVLEKKPDLGAREPQWGWTALHLACAKGMRQAVLRLLAAGAHLEAPDALGNTPLHVAAAHTPELVEILLAHGADPNAVGMNRQTPLHIATLQQGFKLLQMCAALLRAGACPNTPKLDGQTALHHLCLVEDDRPEISILLTQPSWEVDARDAQGATPLMLVAGCRVDKPVAGQALLSVGADPNAVQPGTGLTPLHCAVMQGNFKLMVVLLSGGADPRVRAATGMRALETRPEAVQHVFQAMRVGDERFPALLGAVEAMLSEAERRGVVEQMAGWACQQGQLVPLRCLLGLHAGQVGEVVRRFAVAGQLEGVFRKAVQVGDVEVVEALLAHGVAAEPPRVLGPSLWVPPLVEAVRGGQLGIVRALLAHGADAGVVVRGGSAVLHVALEVAARGKGGGGGDPVAVVEALLEAGADPDAVDVRTGAGVLHVACGLGLVGCVRALVAAGGGGRRRKADVEARDGEGSTGLHVVAAAVAAGGVAAASAVEMVGLLLAAGADAMAKDRRGETPLHVLAGSRVPAALVWSVTAGGEALSAVPPAPPPPLTMGGVAAKIARQLLEAGARGDVGAGAMGMTALHWAAWRGDREVVGVVARHAGGVGTRVRDGRGRRAVEVARHPAVRFCLEREGGV